MINIPKGYIFAIVAGAAVAGTVAIYQTGRSHERSEMEAEASKRALERVTEMVENNEEFLELPERERCLTFMRDSGLPDSTCD